MGNHRNERYISGKLDKIMILSKKRAVSVSVLMPVYNGEKHVAQAVESVLNQTYKNFEFVIIDDGSTDKTERIIRSYKDKRIRYLKNPTNQGIVKSLNRGIDLANGKYIARMDADDICLPRRIETEYLFLESNKKIGVVGTWIKGIGFQKTTFSYDAKSTDIKCGLLFEVPFAHPAVMIRKNVLTKYHIRYSDKYKYVEDYALWVKLKDITEFANIPEMLLYHRFHNQQIGKKYGSETKINLDKLQKEILLGMGIKNVDMTSYKRLRDLTSNLTDHQLTATYSWIKTIINNNVRTAAFPANNLYKALGIRWIILISKSRSPNFLRRIHYLVNTPTIITYLDILRRKITG